MIVGVKCIYYDCVQPKPTVTIYMNLIVTHRIQRKDDVRIPYVVRNISNLVKGLVPSDH